MQWSWAPFIASLGLGKAESSPLMFWRELLWCSAHCMYGRGEATALSRTWRVSFCLFSFPQPFIVVWRMELATKWDRYSVALGETSYYCRDVRIGLLGPWLYWKLRDDWATTLKRLKSLWDEILISGSQRCASTVLFFLSCPWNFLTQGSERSLIRSTCPEHPNSTTLINEPWITIE